MKPAALIALPRVDSAANFTPVPMAARPERPGILLTPLSPGLDRTVPAEAACLPLIDAHAKPSPPPFAKVGADKIGVGQVVSKAEAAKSSPLQAIIAVDEEAAAASAAAASAPTAAAPALQQAPRRQLVVDDFFSEESFVEDAFPEESFAEESELRRKNQSTLAAREPDGERPTLTPPKPAPEAPELAASESSEAHGAFAKENSEAREGAARLNGSHGAIGAGGSSTSGAEDVRALLLQAEQSEARVMARLSAVEEQLADLRGLLLTVSEQMRRVSTAPPESEERITKLVHKALGEIQLSAVLRTK